jgi:acetolactate synthase-1/2/3 large subunit
MNAARDPVVWAGSGSIDAADHVIALSERWSAPIIVTHSAKRRWPNLEHALVIPYPPHEPAVAGLIAASDTMLVVGSDLDAMMTRTFDLQLPPNIVRVDIEQRDAADYYATEVFLQGNANQLIPLLNSKLDVRQHGGGERVRACLVNVRKDLLTAGADNEQATAFLEALDVMQDDAVVVCDMAIAGYWAVGYLRPRRRQILYPIGWGTLGFGLPAAIGAAVARPDRRVVVVCGDAGFLYSTGELATIVENRLAITIVVVDDDGYGMLRYAGSRSFARTFAMDLSSPDFVALGRSFGLSSETASTTADLATLLTRGPNEPPNLVHFRAVFTPPRMALLAQSNSTAAST